MNDKKQSKKLMSLLEVLGMVRISVLPVDEDPSVIIGQINDFRTKYGNLKISDVHSYTYDANNMVIGMVLLRIIKEKWERDHKDDWAKNYEVTVSVYPAMDAKNVLKIYFIPTWIVKGSFEAGEAMNGRIIDFATTRLNTPDPNKPGAPYYSDKRGYIFDLGSSCP